MELNYCSYCNGYGYLNVNLIDGKRLANKDIATYLERKYKTIKCPKCRGHRKLDWIEQIIGVKIGRSSNEKT